MANRRIRKEWNKIRERSGRPKQTKFLRLGDCTAKLLYLFWEQKEREEKHG